MSQTYPGAFPRDRDLSERVFCIQWSLCRIYSQQDWKNTRTTSPPAGKFSEGLGTNSTRSSRDEFSFFYVGLFLLSLSRRGKKRAAEATQFTYGKERPFVIVPRVTGAQAIRPYEGPGTVQEFRIAPSTIVSQYQVPYAKPGQVRILPPRPKTRPYHHPSYPTENPGQWYGEGGAPNRPHYAAVPLRKRRKGLVHIFQKNQEIEERILRQVLQVR